jgi:anti-sigma factor RsiW
MNPEQDPHHTRDDEIVAVLAAARERDRAPASLRERVEHERSRTRRSSGARRSGGTRSALPAGLAGRRLAAAGALVVVLAFLALSLNLFAPSHATPSISQAVALAVRGSSGPPPVVTRRAQGTTRLGENVDELYFPDWQKTIGWRAVGQRVDQLAGRQAITVYYARGAEQVAYTIVATPPLPQPSARQIRTRSLTVHALALGGRTVVTWRRGGNTCVLSSTGVSAPVLASLASWSDQPGTD